MPSRVSVSATPTFTWEAGDPCVFTIVLTADVTSSVFTTAGVPKGKDFKFVIIQDAVGGRAFAWPSICKGALPVAETANQVTVQSFVYDGLNLLATGLPWIA